MKLKYVWIENYTSFNKKQKMQVDNHLTIIIGKNESGKSNLLDGISSCSLMHGINEITFNRKNIKNYEESPIINLEFEFDDNEKKELCLSNRKAVFRFDSSSLSSSKIFHSVVDYFSNKEFDKLVHDVFLGNNSEINARSDPQLKKIRDVFETLKSRTNPNIANHIESLQSIIRREDSIEKDSLLKSIERLNEYVTRMYDLFPEIYLYKDIQPKKNYLMNNEFFQEEKNCKMILLRDL